MHAPHAVVVVGHVSVIFGMNPRRPSVVSVMYLPTVPLEFARPFRNRTTWS